MRERAEERGFSTRSVPDTIQRAKISLKSQEIRPVARFSRRPFRSSEASDWRLSMKAVSPADASMRPLANPRSPVKPCGVRPVVPFGNKNQSRLSQLGCGVNQYEWAV